MIEPTFLVKTEKKDSGYGLFIIEPLEQGFGQTLGNSLRRVLLTSLPGAAVTSVKIENVKHQFSTIAGVKEDVVELILNIKKIKLIIDRDDEVELKLSKKGKGVITAGDIEPIAGVTIVNQDHILGNLTDKNSVFEMTLKAKNGFGYEMASEKVSSEIGLIPVDALFSPVLRVNYRVESTRVGRMTNLDKLVMEVWTDNSLDPEDALKKASKLLVSYFMQIIEPKIQSPKTDEPTEIKISDELLKTRIEELDIPTRIVNALANGGIETVGKLLETPRSEMMKIKNLGVKSLTVVEAKLKEKGIDTPLT